MNLLLKSLLICGAVLSVGCTTLGPKPDFAVSESEIKAVKSVNKILIQPTLGTGTNDQEKDVNKTVPAGAYKRYDDNIVLTAGLGNALANLGFPDETAEMLAINWQVTFYQWVKGLKGKPGKGDLQLPVPTGGKRVAKTEKDLKKLAKSLKKRQKIYSEVAKVVQDNDAKAVTGIQEKHKKALVPIENLLKHMIQRFNITYMVVSYFDGSQAIFDKDEPITLHVALVNAGTGKIRYYAKSSGKKSDLPTTMEGLFGLMSVNLFDEVEAIDKIEF